MTKKFRSEQHQYKLTSGTGFAWINNAFWTHPMWDHRWNDVMMDVLKVVELGADKHGAGSWANKDNPSIEHKACMASMFRHLSQNSVEKLKIDEESGTYHLTHLICRAIMYIANNKINGSK